MMLAGLIVAVVLAQHHVAFADRCFDDMLPQLRCYNLDFPYINTVGLLPESPVDQDIHFQLFTQANPTVPEELDVHSAPSAETSNFVSGRKVAVFIHGFTNSINETWIQEMFGQLLQRVPNVIAVDWKEGAKGPTTNYFQAVANTRVVGAQLATLINTLGVNPARVHLIGHSLGAHVAGYAGEKFGSSKDTAVDKRTLGRITGLDPAGPLFDGFDVRVRLDASDAGFVDVIHTDSEPFEQGGLGVQQPCGDVDFFPNGGHDMPGCEDETATTYDCSHRRAVEYFIASINDNRRGFKACPCSSLEKFDDNLCNACRSSKRTYMGYDTKSDRTGLFVLKTGDTYPFNIL